ncbi:head-tail connector protein [Mycobacterium phage DyoEdafos]|uniref:Uncharacterized protein n=1 Tax=Mycobacterium phage DyoEdafos TaxID=2599860 RepID=A0A5J6TJL0_9CAUD|nr:head-tail connector protein [Mycobacterium phage DyoEdafos]QFG10244.1 hypothetical protein SEA_DYOEDAFOS_12 [Mycobacterium phage DyoEdafos]
MPAAGQKIGHRLTDIQVPKPNKGLAELLLSDNMELLMGIIGQEVVLRYRAKVAKRSGKLMQTADSKPIIGGKKHDRWVAHVTVGGEGAVSFWDSPRNPNPGDLFYYGVLHEFGDGGNPPSGWDFPAAKDLAAVMGELFN